MIARAVAVNFWTSGAILTTILAYMVGRWLWWLGYHQGRIDVIRAQIEERRRLFLESGNELWPAPKPSLQVFDWEASDDAPAH